MKKVCIKSYGCQSNIGDSENIAGILKDNYELVNNEASADIIIVNTCGVKDVTQNKILHYIQSLSKEKKVYVGGCLTSMVDITKYCDNVSGIFDTNSITKVSELLEQDSQITIKISSKTKEDRITLPLIRMKKNTGIINISQGCLNWCTFCGTKLSRGILKSYPIEKIVEALKQAVNEGCTRIHLSSQDNGCYGFDIKTNLSNLLNELVKIEGDFKIRVGMGNPQHIIKILPELISSYNPEKIMKFLHIPLQSGSNNILKQMRRNHKIDDFKKIVNEFRKAYPGISIATDIIVGYPTEREQDFEDTLNLIKEIKPEVLNISKYAKRPKTYAGKLIPLKTQLVKERSRIMTQTFRSY